MFSNPTNRCHPPRFCAQHTRRKGVDTLSAFDMYDLSKTGFVSRRDFREAMRKLQVC